MCTPLRDAASHLPMFFSHLRNLTYPHNLIDLAFLVSDSEDNTMEMLSSMLDDLQNDADPKMSFGEISVIQKDFGQQVQQDVESRHGFAAQASRRKLMAQARNWLLSATLRPTHSWVYWRDADVLTAPTTILEDLMRHDKDVIVPSEYLPATYAISILIFVLDVWRPLPDWLGGEQPYDLNSWQESETALALAETLDEDAVIVEGYAEYATWRPHLAYLRDPYGDPDMEMELDGVGGVSILAKARVFRAGVHFPAFSFEKHAETEGFGKVGFYDGDSTCNMLTRDRWRDGWDFPSLAFRTTRSGIFMSRAWMTSNIWRRWSRSDWNVRGKNKNRPSVLSGFNRCSRTPSRSGMSIVQTSKTPLIRKGRARRATTRRHHRMSIVRKAAKKVPWPSPLRKSRKSLQMKENRRSNRAAMLGVSRSSDSRNGPQGLGH